MLVHQVNMETGGNNVENIRKSNRVCPPTPPPKKKKKREEEEEIK